MSKLISTFKIGFDDETKAEIAALKISLDAFSNGLKDGTIMPTGGLLAAMVGEAANDAPESELKQMGQWVFEGQDEKWVSAHVDSTGCGYYCSLKKSRLVVKEKHWGNHWGNVGYYTKPIGPRFDTTNWKNSAIDRETINDVDYLSETAPEIQGMEASEIIIDEMGRDYSPNSNCLHAVVPQITQADMQLIFIKNLSEVLIQRMRGMDRFSEDDYHVGAEKLMPWDIVYDMGADRFGFVTASQKEHIVACFLKPLSTHSKLGEAACFHKNSLLGKALRTITEDEVSNFCGVLEAYHA